jgi:hypothetical protein
MVRYYLLDIIAMLELETQAFRYAHSDICLTCLFGILLGSPLAVAKAAATLPGFHTEHET